MNGASKPTIKQNGRVLLSTPVVYSALPLPAESCGHFYRLGFASAGGLACDFDNNQTERKGTGWNGRASAVTKGVAAESYGHFDRLGG